MRMVVYIESSLHLCASACRCVHENIQYPLFTVQPYGIWISHHMNDMGLCMLSTGQFGDHRRVRVGVYAVNLITLLIIWMIWITNVCVHAVNQPIRRPTVERERESPPFSWPILWMTWKTYVCAHGQPFNGPLIWRIWKTRSLVCGQHNWADQMLYGHFQFLHILTNIAIICRQAMHGMMSSTMLFSWALAQVALSMLKS